jgi:hypothetical protein
VEVAATLSSGFLAVVTVDALGKVGTAPRQISRRSKLPLSASIPNSILCDCPAQQWRPLPSHWSYALVVRFGSSGGLYNANRQLAGRPIKNLPESITISPDASAADIFQKVADASRFPVHRLRITKGSDGSPLPKSKDVTVHDTGLRNKSAVDVKDLGGCIHYFAPSNC